MRDEDNGSTLHEGSLEAVLEQEGSGVGIDGGEDVVPSVEQDCVSVNSAKAREPDKQLTG